MQLPSNLGDPFVKEMSAKADEARRLFLEHVKEATRKGPVKAMLGDGTVSDQESFVPTRARGFYEALLGRLKGWDTGGVSVTTDQDLRRMFIKAETREGRYVLSCHMSLQYHAVLFYRPDQRVIEVQKELSRVGDEIKQLQGQIAPEGDRIIEERLRSKGYDGLDQQKLFEVLFERDDLADELTGALGTGQERIRCLTERQSELFGELDGLLMEVYHTEPVMIDENRMIAAEEGCMCVFNLEYLRRDSREGNPDLSRIPLKTRQSLLGRMDEIIESMKF